MAEFAGAGGRGARLQAIKQQMSRPDLVGCEVTLYLSFANLTRKDVLSKSDPFAQLEMGGKNYGTTEVIKNQQSGSWAKTFDLRYVFELRQVVTINVWDEDSSGSHDHQGFVAFELGNLMGSPGQTLMIKVCKNGRKDKDRGFIKVHAEKKLADMSGGNLRLLMRGHKFDSKDWGGLRASDPYFVLLREAGEEWLIVYKSEFVKKNNSPQWKEARIPLDKLTRGSLDSPLLLRVFDFDDGSKDDLIGEAKVSVNELVAACREKRMLPMVHPPTKKKYQKASYKHSGLVEVQTAICTPSPTARMLDFIAGGLELNLVVAVDFTGSNGHPSDYNSLHYRSPNRMNDYQSAIATVGHILQAYDSDGQIPAYGFGGMWGSSVSHCFPLNGNFANPSVPGVQGVLAAYEQALANVPLSGPTFFAPLLEKVRNEAYDPEMSQVSQRYTILLILTDGEVMDMSATINELVKASAVPLSVVIVGVGPADFGKMEHLDGDDAALTSTGGQKAARDIVQFVPFRQFGGNAELLAKEVLHEIPGQLVDFFTSAGIAPNPPRGVPSSFAAVESLVVPASAPPTAQAPPLGSANAELVKSGRDLLNKAFHL